MNGLTVTINKPGIIAVLKQNRKLAVGFAELMAAYAAERGFTPWKTGNNAGSIEVRTGEMMRSAFYSSNVPSNSSSLGPVNPQSDPFPDRGDDLYVVTTSGYGGYLELGTRRMKARPYFAPAFERARKDFKL